MYIRGTKHEMSVEFHRYESTNDVCIKHLTWKGVYNYNINIFFTHIYKTFRKKNPTITVLEKLPISSKKIIIRFMRTVSGAIRLRSYNIVDNKNYNICLQNVEQ